MRLAKPLEVTVGERDRLQHLEQGTDDASLIALHLTSRIGPDLAIPVDLHLVSDDQTNAHDEPCDDSYHQSASAHSHLASSVVR
jgi:hypothetical protein